MSVPPSDPTPDRGPRSGLSPVHRAALEDYLEAVEARSEERRRELRERNPSLATEFDAVESAFRRLSPRLTRAPGSVPEGISATGSIDPGISLSHAPGAAPGVPPGDDLLRRISERSIPPSRYRTRREIARGGMGSIQRVWDEDLRRYLVMKVMLRPQDRNPHAKSVPPDSRQLTRFLEEAQITGQLDHPGILPVHDIGIDEEGRLYFTMPLVRGQDLAEVINRARGGEDGWTRTRVLNVLLRVMEATAFAHDRGVVHRDLKPENIMVGRFGETYVMDWGLARVLDELERQEVAAKRSVAESIKRRVKRTAEGLGRGDHLSLRDRGSVETLDGDMVGTPGYMAPEQARGDREQIGPASDIYALGAIIYQLLTGHRPFDDPISRETGTPLLQRILELRPVPIKELDRDQPDELVAICEKAMAEEPEDRYGSVIELIDDVRAFLEGHVVRAYEAGLLAEVRKWVVRNRLLASVGGLALTIFVGAIVALVVQQELNLRRLRDEQARTAEANTELAEKILVANEAEERARKDSAEARAENIRYQAAALRLEEANAQIKFEKDVATRNEREANEAKEKALLRAYVGNVTAARIALRANELREAERLLDACDPTLRRWEWDHLRARLDVSLSAFEVATRGALALEVLDEERLAVVDRDAGLRILSLESGAEIAAWVFEGAPPTGLAHDPVRDQLWISRGGERLRRLDPARPAERFEIGPTFGSENGSIEWGPLALSPDGRALAAGVARAGMDADGLNVAIFDTSTGERLAAFDGNFAREVTSIAWSPDGLSLAAGFDDGFLEVWSEIDAPSFSVEPFQRRVRPHGERITSLVFGSNSRRLAVGSTDNDASLLDVGTLSVLRTLREHSDDVSALAFAPFDTFLVTASDDRGINIWEPSTGRLRGQLRGHDDRLVGVQVTPSGDSVVSLDAEGSIRVWDPRAPDAVTTQTLEPSSRGHWIVPDSTGDLLAVPVGDDAGLVNLKTLESSAALDSTIDLATTVAFDPRREQWVAADSTGLATFSRLDGERATHLIDLPAPADGFALSGDGRTLAAVFRRGALSTAPASPSTALLWRIGAAGPADLDPPGLPFGAAALFEAPFGSELFDLVPTGNGRRLFLGTDRGDLLDVAFSSLDGRATSRSLVSLQRRRELAVVACMRRALGAATLLTATRSAHPLPDAAAPLAEVGALALSPDGTLLAIGFEDGRIEVWRPSESAAPLTLRSNLEPIADLAFDPRGERLASGATDGSVRIFELALGEQVLRLADHSASVGAVAFSPSGQDLLTLDVEGELRVATSASLVKRFEKRRDAEHRRARARNRLIELLEDTRIDLLEDTRRVSELFSRLDADGETDPEVLERIRADVRLFGEDAARLESDAWAVVQDPDRQLEDYRDAYLWALFADYLEPDLSLILRTLGTAHFRLGRHAQAIETLERSVELHQGPARAEELAVLAMAFAALGNERAARECQSELELITQSGLYLRDPVARAFRAEVRDALGNTSSRVGSGGVGGR